MELNDVIRRIVGQHWRLLAACVLGGLSLGLLLAPHGKQYSASARLVLGTPDPIARQQSVAYSDTAKAIATSPSEVSKALRKTGVRGVDPADFASKHVSVSALGSSGVIELSVTDRNRRVAASVANALAGSLIRTRAMVTNGQSNRILADLDRRSEELSGRIAAADDRINTLGIQIAAAATDAEATGLRAQRDAAQNARESLVQQRSVFESERVSLLSTSAQQPQPSIISAATPPSKPEPSHTMVYIVLGALLGLILGLAAAGLIETLRPTLVGGDTLAGELNTALLGTLAHDRAPAVATDVGARLRLAAEAAKVRNVTMVTAGPGVDLSDLADSLNASAAAEKPKVNGRSSGHSHALRIGSFDPENPPFNNGSRTGLVLVSPSALKKTELSDVEHLLQASQLPLLGVITYRTQERDLRRGLKSQIDGLKRAAVK
jgi:capsular polysaccharide biosynthesis protein